MAATSFDEDKPLAGKAMGLACCWGDSDGFGGCVCWPAVDQVCDGEWQPDTCCCTHADPDNPQEEEDDPCNEPEGGCPGATSWNSVTCSCQCPSGTSGPCPEGGHFDGRDCKCVCDNPNHHVVNNVCRCTNDGTSCRTSGGYWSDSGCDCACGGNYRKSGDHCVCRQTVECGAGYKFSAKSCSCVPNDVDDDGKKCTSVRTCGSGRHWVGYPVCDCVCNLTDADCRRMYGTSLNSAECRCSCGTGKTYVDDVCRCSDAKILDCRRAGGYLTDSCGCRCPDGYDMVDGACVCENKRDCGNGEWRGAPYCRCDCHNVVVPPSASINDDTCEVKCPDGYDYNPDEASCDCKNQLAKRSACEGSGGHWDDDNCVCNCYAPKIRGKGGLDCECYNNAYATKCEESGGLWGEHGCECLCPKGTFNDGSNVCKCSDDSNAAQCQNGGTWSGSPDCKCACPPLPSNARWTDSSVCAWECKDTADKETCLSKAGSWENCACVCNNQGAPCEVNGRPGLRDSNCDCDCKNQPCTIAGYTGDARTDSNCDCKCPESAVDEHCDSVTDNGETRWLYYNSDCECGVCKDAGSSCTFTETGGEASGSGAVNEECKCVCPTEGEPCEIPGGGQGTYNKYCGCVCDPAGGYATHAKQTCTESYSNKVWDSDLCVCKCPDKSEEDRCSALSGHYWDSDNCKCMCGHSHDSEREDCNARPLAKKFNEDECYCECKDDASSTCQSDGKHYFNAITCECNCDEGSSEAIDCRGMYASTHVWEDCECRCVNDQHKAGCGKNGGTWTRDCKCDCPGKETACTADGKHKFDKSTCGCSCNDSYTGKASACAASDGKWDSDACRCDCGDLTLDQVTGECKCANEDSEKKACTKAGGRWIHTECKCCMSDGAECTATQGAKWNSDKCECECPSGYERIDGNTACRDCTAEELAQKTACELAADASWEGCACTCANPNKEWVATGEYEGRCKCSSDAASGCSSHNGMSYRWSSDKCGCDCVSSDGGKCTLDNGGTGKIRKTVNSATGVSDCECHCDTPNGTATDRKGWTWQDCVETCTGEGERCTIRDTDDGHLDKNCRCFCDSEGESCTIKRKGDEFPGKKDKQCDCICSAKGDPCRLKRSESEEPDGKLDDNCECKCALVDKPCIFNGGDGRYNSDCDCVCKDFGKACTDKERNIAAGKLDGNCVCQCAEDGTACTKEDGTVGQVKDCKCDDCVETDDTCKAKNANYVATSNGCDCKCSPEFDSERISCSEAGLHFNETTCKCGECEHVTPCTPVARFDGNMCECTCDGVAGKPKCVTGKHNDPTHGCQCVCDKSPESCNPENQLFNNDTCECECILGTCPEPGKQRKNDCTCECYETAETDCKTRNVGAIGGAKWRFDSRNCSCECVQTNPPCPHGLSRDSDCVCSCRDPDLAAAKCTDPKKPFNPDKCQCDCAVVGEACNEDGIVNGVYNEFCACVPSCTTGEVCYKDGVRGKYDDNCECQTDCIPETPCYEYGKEGVYDYDCGCVCPPGAEYECDEFTELFNPLTCGCDCAIEFCTRVDASGVVTKFSPTQDCQCGCSAFVTCPPGSTKEEFIDSNGIPGCKCKCDERETQECEAKTTAYGESKMTPGCNCLCTQVQPCDQANYEFDSSKCDCTCGGPGGLRCTDPAKPDLDEENCDCFCDKSKNTKCKRWDDDTCTCLCDKDKPKDCKKWNSNDCKCEDKCDDESDLEKPDGFTPGCYTPDYENCVWVYDDTQWSIRVRDINVANAKKCADAETVKASIPTVDTADIAAVAVALEECFYGIASIEYTDSLGVVRGWRGMEDVLRSDVEAANSAIADSNAMVESIDAVVKQCGDATVYKCPYTPSEITATLPTDKELSRLSGRCTHAKNTFNSILYCYAAAMSLERCAGQA